MILVSLHLMAALSIMEPPASASALIASHSRETSVLRWALDKAPWPGPFPRDLNADGVLSDYEERGYGRIDTAPQHALAD